MNPFSSLVHWFIIVDLRINEALQIGAVKNRTYRVGLNSVRVETAPTCPDNKFTPFIGGIETEGRKGSFIFRIHYSSFFTHRNPV